MKMDRAIEVMTTKSKDKKKKEKKGQIFDKKTTSQENVNEQLAEELHKQVIKKFKRKKSMRDLTTIFG